MDTRIPIKDTIGVLADLVGQGKAAEIGPSAVDGATLALAHAVHPIAAVQNEYSLVVRSAENDALPRARELMIPFVAYSPLGRGILSGYAPVAPTRDAGDYRKSRAEFSVDRLNRPGKAMDPLRAVAVRRQSSLT